jgi:hypothetical protein
LTVPKANTPLKIGLVTAAASYFLFTLHGVFTSTWIGEWDAFTGLFGSSLYISDISGEVGLVLRLVAGVIALYLAVKYARGGVSKAGLFRGLRWILVFEAAYWLSFLVTAIISLVLLSQTTYSSVPSLLTAIASGAVPTWVESTTIPAALLILVYKLSPNKPAKDIVKWGLIAGTVYLMVFWVINSCIWLAALHIKGNSYLTSYPQNLVSFLSTVVGLLALAIYTGYFTKKTLAENPPAVKTRTIGAIITVLGLYYLWNYLAYIAFGGVFLWSEWYAWFLGHNLDLWMMALPLLGLPLLFSDEKTVQL